MEKDDVERPKLRRELREELVAESGQVREGGHVVPVPARAPGDRLPLLSRFLHGAHRVFGRAVPALDRKVGAHLREEPVRREAGQGVDPAVRRKDDDPLVVHVAQEHEHVLVRGGGVRAVLLPHLVAERQRSLVPVVPVGDEDHLPLHPLHRSEERLGGRHRPDPVLDAEVVDRGHVGRRGHRLAQALQHLVLRVGVEREDRAHVDVRRAHQGKPVLLRPGQRPFVGEHLPFAERRQLQGPEEPLPDAGPLPGDRELLLVVVEGGGGVPDQCPFGEPLAEPRGGARVLVPARPVAFLRHPEVDPGDVFRVAPVQRLLLLRRYDVVRRRHHAGQVSHALHVVMDPPERFHFGHGVTLSEGIRRCRETAEPPPATEPVGRRSSAPRWTRGSFRRLPTRPSRPPR